MQVLAQLLGPEAAGIRKVVNSSQRPSKHYPEPSPKGPHQLFVKFSRSPSSALFFTLVWGRVLYENRDAQQGCEDRYFAELARGCSVTHELLRKLFGIEHWPEMNYVYYLPGSRATSEAFAIGWSSNHQRHRHVYHIMRWAPSETHLLWFGPLLVV